jgi:glycosyltransferase involved in cell wall biosynthesis
MTMEILFAAGHLPAAQGRQAGARVSYYLSEYLARKHRVHMLAFASTDEMTHFNEQDMSQYASWKIETVTSKSRILGVLQAPQLPLAISARQSKSYHNEFNKVLASQRIDVVIFDHTAMFQYVKDLPYPCVSAGLALDVLTQSWERRVTTTNNPFKRQILNIETGRMRTWEKAIFSRLDLVLVLSEKDKTLVKTMQPQANVMVIDPWITTFNDNVGIAREPGALIFWGAMNRKENIDAAHRAADSILPRIRESVPYAKLYLAGSHSEALASEYAGRSDIVVTGFVQDVASLMARMEVALLPLSRGAGIKIKTLECMEAGLPVVTTSVGEEGVGGTRGVHYLVTESDESLAADAISLLRDSKTARTIGDAARKFMSGRYKFYEHLAEVERCLEDHVEKSYEQERTPVV